MEQLLERIKEAIMADPQNKRRYTDRNRTLICGAKDCSDQYYWPAPGLKTQKQALLEGQSGDRLRVVRSEGPSIIQTICGHSHGLLFPEHGKSRRLPPRRDFAESGTPTPQGVSG